MFLKLTDITSVILVFLYHQFLLMDFHNETKTFLINIALDKFYFSTGPVIFAGLNRFHSAAGIKMVK